MAASAIPFVLAASPSSVPGPEVITTYVDSGARQAYVVFDGPIAPISPQAPSGWTIKRLGVLKAIDNIETSATDTLRIHYAGAPVPDQIIWTGSGTAPIGATSGIPAAAFDLTLPWP